MSSGDQPAVKEGYETCPYNDLPPARWWRKAVASVAPADFAPTAAGALRIGSRDRIATAGSCFAQNLSRALVAAGFNFHCVERGPSSLSDAERRAYNYGTFSARYGNIYTAAQLLQLVQQALGELTPAEPAWTSPDGRVFDPFRPQIQPRGFASREELAADRAAHLAAVRRMFETTDVFVFTLGLTEAWRSKVDGAVFPVAPGCGAGRFDPSRHEFHNFTVGEIAPQLSQAIERIARLNPKVRVLLTVSPVPLIATMENRDVLQSTVYSKSVLRVAAEEVAAQLDCVTYFASYEIITATGNAARYFAADRRSVTEEGVAHVMRCFFDLFSDAAVPPLHEVQPDPDRSAAIGLAPLVCDEEALAMAMAAQRSSRVER